MLQQPVRRVILDNLTLIQNHDSVIVDDGVESVSNGNHSAVSKLSSDDALYEVVSFKVNIGSDLIKQQDFASASIA